jgi:hypothetical protein
LSKGDLRDTGENRIAQYIVDIEGLAGITDETWPFDDYYDQGSPLGLHDETLFDQDEDASGERFNLATGEIIDNTGPIEISALREARLDDIIAKLDDEEDREQEEILVRLELERACALTGIAQAMYFLFENRKNANTEQ